MTDRTPDRLFVEFRETGDPSALAGVFDRTAPEILRVATHLARDSAEAEDLLQATFVTAIEAARSFDPARPVLPWLLGILANHARKSRGKRRPAPLPALDPADRDDAPARAAERGEITEEVRRAIDALPEPYRRALLLRLVHGLEPVEIAHLLDAPPPTVRSWLKRGLERLRRGLPAGLTASLALLIPAERGLAAVRASVLAHVPKAAVLSGAAATMGGAVAMKKTLTVAAVLFALLVAGTVAFSPFGDSPDAPPVPVAPGLPVAAIDGNAPEDAADVRLPDPVDLSKVDRDRDLHGVVVRTDGSPVAGARIGTTFRAWRSPHVLRGAKKRDGPSVRSAVDGTFSIRLDPGALCDLTVEAEGYVRLRLSLAQAGERVRVVLPAVALLTARVRDEDGKPVAGAGVRLTSAAPYRNDDLQFHLEGVTAADGAFVFEGVPGGRPLGLAAWHGDFGLAERRELASAAAGGGIVDVVLPAGMTVRGQVVSGETREPIEGARIHEYSKRREAVTDADGAYVFRGFTRPAKKHHRRPLDAEADGYVRMTSFVPEDLRLDFALHRGTGLTGRVVDPTGRPVPGALVSAGGHDGQGRSFQRGGAAESDGRFRLTGIPHAFPGTIVITSGTWGRVLYDFTSAKEAGETLDVGDVALTEAGSVVGRVLLPDGTPIARALVYLEGGNEDRAALNGGRVHPRFYVFGDARRSDDLGRFLFPALAPGRYKLSVSLSDGRQRTQEVLLRPGEPTARADVRFEAGGFIDVFVVDDRGDPLAGFTAFVQTESGNFQARTDAEGHARISPEGEARAVRIYDPERRYLVADPWKPRPLEGKKSISFTAWPAGEVSGRVLGPDGEPLWGALIRVVSGGRLLSLAMVRTDEKGRFTAAAPARGSFDLIATWERFAGTARSVQGGASDVEIRAGEMPADRSLRVLALDPDGRPLAGVNVSILWQSGTTDDRGRVTFDALPARPGHLTVKDSDVVRARRYARPPPVEVLPAGQEIVLRFRRTDPLRGRVVDAAGAPVAGARVSGSSVFQSESGAFPTVVTDGDGRFELRVPEDARGSLRLNAWTEEKGRIHRQAHLEGARVGDPDATIQFSD